MGIMVEGEWRTEERARFSEDGRYVRPATAFRDTITDDGSTGFKAEPGRYHLYVSWTCPWAHRTLIVRKLRGLERAIGVSVTSHAIGPNGWEFDGAQGTTEDAVNGARYLWEIYRKARPDYTGRVSVPVLWDRERETIVSNESAEIIRMLDTAFSDIADPAADFYPAGRDRPAIDAAIERLYEPVNNGVYKAGFARSQAAYDAAVGALFDGLDHWERALDRHRYACGDRLTEADWCFFPTLYRFDLVYYAHFKCNVRRIADYPNLSSYLRDLYQTPGVAETCRAEYTKRGYYAGQPFVNPTGIVPRGPQVDYDAPHDRALRAYGAPG